MGRTMVVRHFGAPLLYPVARMRNHLIDLKEILVANGITILMMWFLLHCRRKNRESIHAVDRFYDGMCMVNLAGALFETVSYLVDGQSIAFGIAINYLSNGLCFLGTVSIGMMWCMYVDLRIYRNYKRTLNNVKFVIIPWAIELVAIVCTLAGTGFMFWVSPDNVYHRSTGAVLGYATLIVYFVYSIFLVLRSRKRGVNLQFFPVQYFLAPCVAGVVVQFLFYGITLSWLSVGIALIFVQMQTYARSVYTDELSGLFNRRYLKGVLAKHDATSSGPLYGIMLDVNDFKYINDTFGHNTGDLAICAIGDVLFKSLPENGIAIRYAGDEFVVLLPGADEKLVRATIDEINAKLDQLNNSGEQVFSLNIAMGYALFETNDTSETFLHRMDEGMYAAKRRYKQAKKASTLSSFA